MRKAKKRCRICGGKQIDHEWEAIAGPDPGFYTMRLGHARHNMTGLGAMLTAMEDDSGVWRCVTCLAAVDASRIYRKDPGGYGRIGVPRLETGYELLCCGADGRRHEET